MFSPEFGGMTANIEFEALTGFSNAFLPAGSIPYQQYVRTPTPSLATFLKSEGYEARAIHPGTNCSGTVARSTPISASTTSSRKRPCRPWQSAARCIRCGDDR